MRITIQYVLGVWIMLLLWGMEISSRMDQVISFPVKLVICLSLLLLNVASGFGRLKAGRGFSGGFHSVLLHLVNAAALIGYLTVMVITYEPDPTVEVVVAAHDLPAGHVLIGSDLETRTFVKTAIWEDIIIDPQELVGKALCADIEERALFNSNYLHMNGLVAVDGNNERPVFFHLDRVVSGKDLLRPGAHVNLSIEKIHDGKVFQTEMENLRVVNVCGYDVALAAPSDAESPVMFEGDVRVGVY